MATNGLMKTLGLAGAALAAWYLLDPKKGAGRREKLAQGARDTYNNLGRELSRIGEDIATGVTDTVSRVGELTGLAGGTEKSGAESPSHRTEAAEATGRV